MKLAAGAVLQNGKYLLNHALGPEAFSLTYRATQTYLQQPVVIKTLHPSLLASANFGSLQERFIAVTRYLARTQHPSLVRILDFFQEGGLPFMVMEFVPGDTLAAVMQSGGRILKPEAIHYARQLGTALGLMHDRGWSHGNLKPHNIVRRQGTNLAVLLGCGISHELTLASAQVDAYSAPECKLVPHPTAAIDLYSLSATLSYLLTGHVLGAQDPAPAPGQPSLETAIVHGLARDPRHRPPTVAAWLELLPPDTLPLVAAPLRSPSSSPRSTSSSRSSSSSTRAAQSAAMKPMPPSSPPTNGHASSLASPAPRYEVINPAAAPPVPQTTPAPKTTPAKTILGGGSSGAARLSASSPVTPPLTSGAPSRAAGTAPQVTLLTYLRQRHLVSRLGLLAAVASAIGVGLGLALRFSATKNPGFSFLNPNQTFPDRDWKGPKSPTMKQSDLPIEPPGGFPDVMDPLGDIEPVQRQPEPPPPNRAQPAPVEPPSAPAPAALPPQSSPVAPPALAEPANPPAIADPVPPPEPAVPSAPLPNVEAMPSIVPAIPQ